ncbi:restriction endonuclease subunit S [Streptomyces sp. NPDC006875]|uniref:restriction endonuclease subunit S n=1 Tax=Streptomyces sp. NPDC006875 TaxID=3154781 RepID=UPI00340BDA4E
MSEWIETTIGDIATVFDGPHATPRKTETGPWFLSISSLDKGRLNLAESAHVSEEDFATWTRRVTPEQGDVLFSYETRLGEAALMPGGIRACLGRRMAILRPKRTAVDPQFLLYSYLAPEFQDTIAMRRIHGATVDRISLASLPSWPIRIPALAEQRAIVSVLASFDDKIAINERIAATTDALSTKLFRHAALTSPLRFTEQALSDTAEFINGRAFTKDATGTGRMVVRIAEINSGPGGSTVYNDIDVPEKYLARPGDVLFAWSGSLTVTRWFRPEAIINQHIFKCVPKNGFPQWLISQLVHRKIDEFRAIAADKATTMGHIQRKHLDEPVLVPTSEALTSLDTRIGPLWERALLAEQETLSLANLRDILLPQLMSGRLRVKDAEKIVEDHV